MLLFLQSTVLCLLCLVTILGVWASWLGLSPEVDFLSFLTKTGVFFPLLGFLAFIASLITYLLGWDPTQRVLQWFRVAVVIPVFTSIVMLCVTAVGILGLLAVASMFLWNFDRPVIQEVIVHLRMEDYAQTDRSIAGSKLPSSRIADLTFINDSLRQAHFNTTGDPAPDLCRVYLSYFEARRHAFQPVWWRYLYGRAIAACQEVTGDQNAALDTHRTNVKLARWLKAEEVRRAWRHIAAFHFRDSGRQTDISDKHDRLTKVLEILATDPDITARRMRGVAQYLLGNYAEAIKIWTALIDDLREGNKIERKRLLNSSAMAYGALDQHQLAIGAANKGLNIDFSTTDEAERREQIRLLATMAILKLGTDECEDARTAWDKRERLKRQNPSPCGALIAAQIMSCGPLPSEQEEIIDLLRLGTGLKAATVVGPTSTALTKLLDQASRKFAQCYIGLDFDAELVKKAVTRLPASQISR